MLIAIDQLVIINLTQLFSIFTQLFIFLNNRNESTLSKFFILILFEYEIIGVILHKF